ncbi:MAG: MFS transporter [Gammaproteobacteria bacterium]|nr:MFS transporter [Gammaproteobacteria bacterium]
MSRTATVVVLGIGQTLGWGSTYYLPAVLAAPMAQELGVPTAMVYAAFSASLVLSALVGPLAGRLIDAHGGRGLLMATNVVFALGLAALGAAQGVLSLFAAWAVLGIGMGSGLYEAAFATVVRLWRYESRNAITGITLIAGFASTVAWPLSAWLNAEFGWRIACLAWAGLHLGVALPLHMRVPRPSADEAPAEQSAASTPTSEHRSTPELLPANPTVTAAVLGYVFAVTWFIATAMAAHLPRMLEAAGASVTLAVAAGALIGPAQVGARLLEFSLLRHISPLFSARLAALAHPLGALVLLFGGGAYAAAFTVLHGAGNGILTIAKGTLPLVFFGPDGYGARQGWLMLPARVAQAVAPLAFSLALDGLGGQVAWLSGGLATSALLALLVLRPPVRRL